MANNNLKREPITINNDAWAYEEGNGISIYTSGNGRIGRIHISTIRAYLKRADKDKKRKGKQ